MTIKLRPKAYDDLTSIYQYSLKEFGQVKATEYLTSMDEAFHKLNLENDLGSDYGHIRAELLAYQVASHIVFFKRSKHSLIVIRILHQMMDFKRHLQP